jgi:ribosomal protein L10
MYLLSDNQLYKNSIVFRLELDEKTEEQRQIYLEDLLKNGMTYFLYDEDRDLFKKYIKELSKEYSYITEKEEIEIEATALSLMNRSLFIIE